MCRYAIASSLTHYACAVWTCATRERYARSEQQETTDNVEHESIFVKFIRCKRKNNLLI